MATLTLTGASGTYRVGGLLATSQGYRLWLAKELTTDQHCLLQVATSIEANGGIDRAAFLLNRFKATADVFDVAYAKNHERKHLHYERLYPSLIESFIALEQGGRRINALSLADVDDIFRITPLSNLRRKERVRLDPESSAWVMGRLLKLLSFTHGEGVSNRSLTANNVLLDPKQHFAVTLDWSNARVFPDQVPSEDAAVDIASAAKAVFVAIGGDPITKAWPYEGHVPYVSLLRQLMEPSTDTALLAETTQDQFYELVRREYGSSFHPFTTLPL